MLIFFSGLGAFAVMGAGQTAPKTLEVQKIILKDALGNERAPVEPSEFDEWEDEPNARSIWTTSRLFKKPISKNF